MSKITNVLMMLDYLSTGKKYTIKQLSSKLGVTERMIRYYKQELESAGIYIDSFKGPNGGYYIIKAINSYNHINKYDIELIKAAQKTLKNNNFKYIEKFNNLVDKLEHAYKIEEEKSKFSDALNKEENNNTIKSLKAYIKKKSKIKIIYEDLSGESKERWIHPLLIYKFDEKVYITAYCELRNDIRQFELNRIKNISEN